MSGAASIGSRSDASAGPSISTATGLSASSASTRRRADPGPWCRIPNSEIWPVMPAPVSDPIGQRSIIAFEAALLLQYRLQIFAEHGRVLHRILHDRADHVAGERFRRQL